MACYAKKFQTFLQIIRKLFQTNFIINQNYLKINYSYLIFNLFDLDLYLNASLSVALCYRARTLRNRKNFVFLRVAVISIAGLDRPIYLRRAVTHSSAARTKCNNNRPNQTQPPFSTAKRAGVQNPPQFPPGSG